MSDLPEHVIGFTAKGKVTGEDYASVLIPAIEEKLKKHSKINFLYHMGKDCASRVCYEGDMPVWGTLH